MLVSEIEYSAALVDHIKTDDALYNYSHDEHHLAVEAELSFPARSWEDSLNGRSVYVDPSLQD